MMCGRQYIAQIRKGATAENMPCSFERSREASTTLREGRAKTAAEAAPLGSSIAAALASKHHFLSIPGYLHNRICTDVI
jgi:hypothetical protein